jgi:hypothetical protein
MELWERDMPLASLSMLCQQAKFAWINKPE